MGIFFEDDNENYITVGSNARETVDRITGKKQSLIDDDYNMFKDDEEWEKLRKTGKKVEIDNIINDLITKSDFDEETEKENIDEFNLESKESISNYLDRLKKFCRKTYFPYNCPKCPIRNDLETCSSLDPSSCCEPSPIEKEDPYWIESKKS